MEREVEMLPVPVGRFYTPLPWAKWALERLGVLEAWTGGASVGDPTAGEGVFLLALLELAREHGVIVTDGMLGRLYYNEIEPAAREVFEKLVRENYGYEAGKMRLFCQDVILCSPAWQCDFLVGNPPWANFTELPEDYKTQLKPAFIAAGLVGDKRRMLWGATRIDIAALVLQVAMGRLLAKGGQAVFFLPMSLFFCGEANVGFRSFCAFGRSFRVDWLYCFQDEGEVFAGVRTAYCAAAFHGDAVQTYPVPCVRRRHGLETHWEARPLFGGTDIWCFGKAGEQLEELHLSLSLKPEQRPRQGINTCGCNRCFIFDEKPAYLPESCLYPLVESQLWHGMNTPHKWVFLPYDRETGRIWNAEQVAAEPRVARYLEQCRADLCARKGRLLANSMERGLWWALLGVGPYSFAPWKVIWQAFGKREFHPLVVGDWNGQPWQANQAMHAFIPCQNREEAMTICQALEQSSLQKILESMNSAGQCNWAQPGKMTRLIMNSLAEKN